MVLEVQGLRSGLGAAMCACGGSVFALIFVLEQRSVLREKPPPNGSRPPREATPRKSRRPRSGMRVVCSSCDANNMGVVCSAVFSATVVLFVLQLSLLCSVVCFAVVSATVGVGCLQHVCWLPVACLFRSCLCDRGVVCSAVVSAIGVCCLFVQFSLRRARRGVCSDLATGNRERQSSHWAHARGLV